MLEKLIKTGDTMTKEDLPKAPSTEDAPDVPSEENGANGSELNPLHEAIKAMGRMKAYVEDLEKRVQNLEVAFKMKMEELLDATNQSKNKSKSKASKEESETKD